MKKLLIGVTLVMAVAVSCKTSSSTIRKVDINDTNLITEPKLVHYDVDLNKKLTGTVKMSNKYGVEFIKSAAVAEALKGDSSADLIVDPQYQIKSGLLKTEVTVTGYWGKYTSVETLDTAYMKYYMEFNMINSAPEGTSGPMKMKLFKRK